MEGTKFHASSLFYKVTYKTWHSSYESASAGHVGQASGLFKREKERIYTWKWFWDENRGKLPRSLWLSLKWV